jgi:Fic family protein
MATDRTDRVFNIHYLTKKGLLDSPILFLSRYILNHKDEYYTDLMGVSQRGDWKNWLLYMLRAIETTSAITYHTINDIVAARDSILNHIKKEGKAIRKPDELVGMIFMQPFTKVKHLQAAKFIRRPPPGNTSINYAICTYSKRGLWKAIIII